MKQFHISDLLSVTTGRLVSNRHIEGVYDVLNFLTGDDLFTHQLPRASEECKPWLATQFPTLMEDALSEELADMDRMLANAHTKELRDRVVQQWVEAVRVARGYPEMIPVYEMGADMHTHIDPVEELRAMVGDEKGYRPWRRPPMNRQEAKHLKRLKELRKSHAKWSTWPRPENLQKQSAGCAESLQWAIEELGKEPRYALNEGQRRTLTALQQRIKEFELDCEVPEIFLDALSAALALEEPFTRAELEVARENLTCRNPTHSKHGNDPCGKCPECALAARLDAMLERTPGDDTLKPAEQLPKP